VCPELDNKLYNLKFMPATINGKKGAKVGLRQLQLGRQWHKAGLLSMEGLANLEEAGKGVREEE
jgi:hypothetical protein